MGGAAASGSGSAAARERVARLVREVELECGDISASQEDLLTRAPFLGGGGEEAEVFSTPPLTHRQEEEAVTMCSMPFTQPSPSPASSPPDTGGHRSRPRKPRICTRKVRGAKIRTPTPSPDPRPSTSRSSGVVDPLYKAVLMIPSKPLPPTEGVDILELARQRGIF